MIYFSSKSFFDFGILRLTKRMPFFFDISPVLRCILEIRDFLGPSSALNIKRIFITILMLVGFYPHITLAQEKTMISRKNYSSIIAPVGPYVHASSHNGVLYTSGLSAFGTSAEKKGIVEQTREIFNQLELILKEENSGIENLIKVTIYVSDLSVLAELRETLFKIYGENIPASAVVEVSKLFDPSVKIEIEAIAALNEE